MRTSYSLDYEYKLDEKTIKKEIIVPQEAISLQGGSLVTKSQYKDDFKKL